MEIPVIRSVFESNEKRAEKVRSLLTQRNILTINLISSPGAGKTTLLEHTLAELKDEFHIAVIEGDLQTDNDAKRIAATGVQVVQINTEGGCHLESSMIQQCLDSLSLDTLDILVIENVGNLVCPVEFDLGEDCKVALLSVTEGDDKPEKYPLLFQLARVLLVTKTDLLPYVAFDTAKAEMSARRNNPDLTICEISCTKNEGLADWYNWIRKARQAKKEGLRI
ncbi:MAG: hydrogenase nickel incorporation protein HypB [Desulfovibrionaceae bacterium]|nr:hydrogenase nickel incorporation protein HypB [Desulfovibrionaceae bacterium]